MTLPFEHANTLLLIDEADLSWLAGWLEGEGHFGNYNPKGTHEYPRITVSHTDWYQINEGARLLEAAEPRPYPKLTKGGKQAWWFHLNSRRAYEAMKLILPYVRSATVATKLIGLIEQHRDKYER